MNHQTELENLLTSNKKDCLARQSLPHKLLGEKF